MRREPKPEDIALGRRIQTVRLEIAGGIDPARFAEPLGVTRQAVVNWERGHGAGRASLKKIATAYDVSFDWLATNEGSPRPTDDADATPVATITPDTDPRVREIPVYSMVAAGNLRDQPGISEEDILRWLKVADLPRTGDWIALQVDGDSMNLVAPHGATILVNRADATLIDGRFYVFALENRAATFKQYRRTPDRLQPYSTNPEHFSIPATDDIYVVGRARRVITDL